MAQLTAGGRMDQRSARWNPHQTWAQYAAIAWLRWRILINLSRRANSAGEIAGRVVLDLLLGSFALFLTAAAGAAAWYLTDNGHLGKLWLEFWGIFLLCQLLNINLGQPGTTFDPTELIRFPLRVPTYVFIRLFFNLLSPANVMAALMSLAVAVGVTIALPRLALYALAACSVFAITNVLFSRMVFAWVDRWLSTRRARELFTAAIFIVSMGFQYVNFTYNPAYHRSRHHSAATRQQVSSLSTFTHRAEPFLRFLPPDLTSRSLASAEAQRPGAFFSETLGCSAYAAVFLLVFAQRMRKEFRGESLSDTASASSLPAATRPLAQPVLAPPIQHAPNVTTEAGLFTPALLALLGKEWTYMRRNTGLIYGLLTPLFLIVLFALRMGRNYSSPWIVPVAIAYSLVGIAPMSYNSFGLDGTGAQLYFISPVPLRLVFLAKNLLHFAIALFEVLVVVAVMAYVSSLPRVLTLLGILLWVIGSLLFNTTLGNRRSVTMPKKIDLSRMARRQASQTSALLSLGILAACVGFGAGVLALVAYFNLPWMGLLCFLAFVAGGAIVYSRSLQSMQSFTLAHRDTLFEELGKS